MKKLDRVQNLQGRQGRAVSEPMHGWVSVVWNDDKLRAPLWIRLSDLATIQGPTNYRHTEGPGDGTVHG